MAAPVLRWACLAFPQLDAGTLYALMRQRQEVFIVEQRCAYLDADGADPDCAHLLGRDAGGQLQASLRIVPPGLKYDEASIGRVVTSPSLRGSGLGIELMAQGVRHCERLHPARGIRISAQAHLQRFYRRFDFEPVGEPYLEDNIPHIEMLRPASVGTR